MCLLLLLAHLAPLKLECELGLPCRALGTPQCWCRSTGLVGRRLELPAVAALLPTCSCVSRLQVRAVARAAAPAVVPAVARAQAQVRLSFPPAVGSRGCRRACRRCVQLPRCRQLRGAWHRWPCRLLLWMQGEGLVQHRAEGLALGLPGAQRDSLSEWECRRGAPVLTWNDADPAPIGPSAVLSTVQRARQVPAACQRMLPVCFRCQRAVLVSATRPAAWHWNRAASRRGCKAHGLSGPDVVALH